MAQRVFLIQLPVDDLRLVSEAIKGSPAQRLDVAATLAEASAAHLRRVALSERMAAACAQGTNTDRWGYGQYCMPYLLAASTADEIVASLRRLEAIDSDAELVRFFHQQALQLGASLSQPPDREKYQAPPRDAVQRFIASQLDRAASLRQLAVSSPSEAHLTDFAVSTWVWLGRLFARLRPAFWEGRNRWLGGAASRTSSPRSRRTSSPCSRTPPSSNGSARGSAATKAWTPRSPSSSPSNRTARANSSPPRARPSSPASSRAPPRSPRSSASPAGSALSPAKAAATS